MSEHPFFSQPGCSRREWLVQAAVLGSAFCSSPSLAATQATTNASAAAATDGPKVFASTRSDGRFVDTLGWLHAQLKANPPNLAYNPAMTREQFETWRNQVRDRLKLVLGLPEVPPQPEPKKIWSQRRDGYEIQRWEAYPEPWAVAPFLLLVPDGVSAQSPAPAVICLPGSADTKEVLVGEPELLNQKPHPLGAKNCMARDYVRVGLIAVAMDNPGVGEPASALPGGWNAIGLNALWSGRSFEGISVFHKQCVLKWLKRQPFVKTDRIAVSGHSLGAKPALSLAILDESVAALVWNDAFADWRRRAIATNLWALGVTQYVPGLLEWFDYLDLIAALAPRPVLGTEGARIPELKRLQTAWQKFDAEDALKVVQQPKFADPANRKYDDQEDLPEGLTYQEWCQFANVDPANHYFKSEIAVPWLVKVLA